LKRPARPRAIPANRSPGWQPREIREAGRIEHAVGDRRAARLEFDCSWGFRRQVVPLGLRAGVDVLSSRLADDPFEAAPSLDFSIADIASERF
jgi:hypothetical protein